MVTIQEPVSLQPTGARTSDWIGQIKGGVLYAYDLDTLIHSIPSGKGLTFAERTALEDSKRRHHGALEKLGKL
jgi:hypothetical protein